MKNPNTPAPRKSVWQYLGQIIDFLEKWVVVFFLTGIVVLIFSGVLSRFVFSYSLAFTEELARFLFVWGALLGASSAYRTGEHSGIPLLANRFGRRGRRVIEIFVTAGVLVFLIYLVLMTSVSTMRSYQSGQISTTTEIPVWTINFGMMLAFLIGILRCIQGFMEGAFNPSNVPTIEPQSE